MDLRQVIMCSRGFYRGYIAKPPSIYVHKLKNSDQEPLTVNAFPHGAKNMPLDMDLNET